MIRTECGICGVTSSSPTRAAKHVLKHRKQRPSLSIHAQSVAENRGKWDLCTEGMVGDPPPDHLVCGPSCAGRGDDWQITACLCDCHYQGKTARQMMKEVPERG